MISSCMEKQVQRLTSRGRVRCLKARHVEKSFSLFVSFASFKKKGCVQILSYTRVIHVFFILYILYIYIFY